ncbi:MAG: hypothetical protein Q4F29_01330 [Lachnospiraceae bacterium]|nr:hypothetical protein [Lachnospiraceae bacterium]
MMISLLIKKMPGHSGQRNREAWENMAGIIGDYQYIEFSAESKDAYLFPGRFCSKLIDRKKGKIVNVAIGKDVTVKARNRCERTEKGQR